VILDRKARKIAQDEEDLRLSAIRERQEREEKEKRDRGLREAALAKLAKKIAIAEAQLEHDARKSHEATQKLRKDAVRQEKLKRGRGETSRSATTKRVAETLARLPGEDSQRICTETDSRRKEKGRRR
jgi:hypothetical protein